MSLAANLVAGAEAVKMALECTPKGSNNKGDRGADVAGTRAYATQILTELKKFNSSHGSDGGTVGILNKLLSLSSAARAKGNGNCMEVAAIAFSYLYQRGIRPLDFMKFDADGYNHCWLVIGRVADAKAALSTWGADSVWCDPWGAKAGLNFSVNGLVNGTTPVPDHNLHYAIHYRKLRGNLANVLTAGNPTLVYRAGGI